MPVLNDGLTTADFKAGAGRFTWSMRASDLAGFQGTPTVVTLRGGFKIYKLTGDRAREGNYGVTPWWSTVEPWMEDLEGAKGRYEQAVLNGIDMSSMARYMSAVVVGWNSLSDYVEVSIHPSWTVQCFWGKFAPMKLIGGAADIDKSADYGKATSAGFSDAVLPADIGVLEAWQLYIPGLKDIHLAGGAQRTVIDAHDMAALGRHFGIAGGAAAGRGTPKMPSAGDFMRSTFVSMYQTRNALLKKMDDTLKQFETACPGLTPNVHNAAQMALLKNFCDDGDQYKTQSTDPIKIKNQVAAYVAIARDWMR
jgi:hypothetical protein